MIPGTDENAAAEMIGSLTLIAVFIAAIALIGVTLFSQPLPQKIPAAALTITNESGHIGITHNGGDPILFTELAIRVDNQPVVPGSWACTGCGNDFSIGDTIQIDFSGSPDFPRRVDIISGKDNLVLEMRYL